MDIYTQTPKLIDTKCKILNTLLSWFLGYGAYIIALSIWWSYNWYFAISALLLSFILIGILRSKLLYSSIPKVQQELAYSDKDISSWYLYLYICPKAQ